MRDEGLARRGCVGVRHRFGRGLRDEILAAVRAERAEWDAQMNRRLDQTDENVRFLGELDRRGEIIFQDVVRNLREMRGEIRASTETTEAHARSIVAVIDRLEGGRVAPAT